MPGLADSGVTQVLYLTIPIDRSLNDAQSYHGKLWSAALDVVEHSDGFQRLYWGRSLEKAESVQLHIVRQTLQQHRDYAVSQVHHNFRALIQSVSSSGSANPITAVRHVALQDFTPNSQALGKGAPFSGTAIYLRPTATWHKGAWPLWTHIVRDIDDCRGCSGGQILEPFELLEKPVLVGEVAVDARTSIWEGFLVYVGWETVEKHEEYHHTEHFAEHRVILRCGNAGYAEYGHVVFEGGRESASSMEPRL